MCDSMTGLPNLQIFPYFYGIKDLVHFLQKNVVKTFMSKNNWNKKLGRVLTKLQVGKSGKDF